MNKRGPGILLHVTSLPSSYGVGDLGPEAYRFADFLAKTKQSYWQVLPLNPTDPIHGNSLYSSLSAFAGNTLLISPDLLLEEGLLSRADLEPIPPFPQTRCDFPEAIRSRQNCWNGPVNTLTIVGKGGSPLRRFVRKMLRGSKIWLSLSC